MKKQKMLDCRLDSPYTIRADVNDYLEDGWKVKKMKLRIDKDNRISGVIVLEKKVKDAKEEDT